MSDKNNDSSYRCQIHLYGLLIQYTLSLFSHKPHLNITGSTSIWAGNLQGSLKLAGERLQIQQRPLLPRNLDCKPVFLLQCFGPSSCWTDFFRKCRSHNFLKSHTREIRTPYTQIFFHGMLMLLLLLNHSKSFCVKRDLPQMCWILHCAAFPRTF